MKQFAKVFAQMFDRGPVDSEAEYRRHLQREWDLQRASALTPQHREEIDAIFSRAL